MEIMHLSIVSARIENAELIAQVQVVSDVLDMDIRIRCAAEADVAPHALAYDVALRHLDPA